MKNYLEIKQKLHRKCTEYIDDRIQSIQKKLDDIQESRSNETKSSAGDKHETGRTMMQIEEQKMTVQLYAANDVRQILQKIDAKILQSEIGLGSLVLCNTGSYYIAISSGKMKIEDSTYYGISLQTPIAKMLLGKSREAKIEFNGKTIEVIGVY